MSAARFFDGRLQFEAGAFVYAGHRVAYGDVAGVEFKQHSYTTRDGEKTKAMYESSLRLVMKSGRKLVIRPDTDMGKRVRTADKALHESMARAADWMGAYTFDTRMDGYEAALRSKGYVTWGRHQINARGELYCRHAYCMDLLDEQVRCMMYPFHMACVKRPKVWWKRWLSMLLNTGEVVDLRRDRDCFLYFARRRLGLNWGGETLRVYRGMPAEGLPEKPKAEAAKEPLKDAPREAPRAEPKREVPPPPPPPRAKTMPTHVQHLAALGLGPDAAWDTVKMRYRQLVRVHHPDLLRGKGAKEATIRQAEETLKTVNEAYGWLEDFYRMKQAPRR